MSKTSVGIRKCTKPRSFTDVFVRVFPYLYYSFLRMREIYGVILLLLAFQLSLPVLGQKEDVSKYFDDGGISNHDFVVKCNLTSAVAGDIPVYLEYTVNRFFKVEAGVGLMPFVGTELVHPVGRDLSPAEVRFGTGFSLSLHPKYYIEIEPDRKSVV